MNRNDIENKIRTIIGSVSDIDPQVHQLPSSEKLSDHGIDSLDMIEILMKMETTFSISIPDDEIDFSDEDITLDQLVSKVEYKLMQTNPR